MALRDDENKIVYEETPKYLKNSEGRVFIATPELIEMGTLEPCDGPEAEYDDDTFNYMKAKKEDLIRAIRMKFDVDLPFSTSIKKLRDTYGELNSMFAEENGAGDNSDQSTGD